MRVRVFKIWQIVKFYLFKSLKKIHKSLKHTSKHISHYSSPIFAKVPKSYRQYIRPYVYPIYRRTLGPIIKFVLKLISHIYKKIRRLLKSHKFKAHARFIKLGFEAVILVAVIVGGYKYITRPNYNISSSAQKIIGTPDISLASKFVSYSKADKSYYLNKKAIGQKAKANTIQVGSTSQATYSYKAPVDISRSEMTFYDNTNNLSFSITPSFKTASGKYKNGEFIYPMSKGQQAVYSIKDNGVKEDIILNKNLGDKTSLDFKLNLPDTLSAKLMPSGAIGIYSASPMLLGNVSASSSSDQALLKKARTSSAKDTLQFVLMPPTVASSQNSDKEKERAKTKAQFALNGNNLTIKASGLSKLTYPISIDPTVVVSSALTSGNNESNANITGSSITTNSLTGGSIGSWTPTTTFATTTSGTMPARSNFGTAVYNGYIYVLGGAAGTSTGDCTATSNYCNGTWYAQINANGTLGSWTPTTTFATTTSGTMPARSNFGTAVYNGYIYVLGGFSAGCPSINTSVCNDTWYAQINANGTLGSWTPIATATFPAGMGPRASFGTAVYNGYIYALGGFSSNIGQTTHGTNCSNNVLFWTVCNDTWYAQINANGTLGSWTSTTTFATTTSGTMPARSGLGTAVYNGYIYAIGGQAAALAVDDCTATSNYCNGTWYSKISNPGATGPSDSPVATPLPNLFQPSVVVYNSFIYVLAGCTSITNSTKWCNGGFNQTIYYAPITTDGTLGTWSIVGGITTSQTFGASAVAWDGSIYVISGCNATATTKSCSGGFNHDFQVSLNNSTGAPMGYTADIYSTLTSVWGATSVIYNGYLYVIGGCKVDTPIVASELCATSSSQSGTTDLIQSVALPAGGGNVGIAYTSQTNKLSKAVFMATSVVYNNKLYVIGGCVGSSTTGNSNECGTSNAGILKDVQYASFTSNSTIGTFTDNTVALPTGLFGASAVVNNGYLYVIGGCTAISNVATYAGCGAISNSIYYTPLSNFSSSTTLTQTNNLSSGLWGFGAVIVNGYVLTIAGCSANATASAIGCGAITNTYQKIKINNGGSGGLISCTGSASSPYCDSNMNYATSNSITGSTSTIYNGKLYIIGGLATTSLGNMSSQCLSSSYLTSNVPSSTDSASASVASIICDQVNVYNILSNGGLSFQNSFPMNLGKYNATVLAYNNKLYVIGGISCFEFIDCSSNESWTADDIQMASISSDGSLGSFTDATPVTGWVSAKNSPSICTTLLLNAVCVNYGSPYSQYLNKTGNYTSYSDSTNYSKGDVVYYANDKAPADNGYYACIASGCGNIPSSSFWLKICSPNSLKYNCSNTTLGYLFGSVASNDTLNNSTLGSAAIYNNYLFITSSFGTNDYSVLVNSDGTLSSTASNTLVNQNSASSNDYMGRTTYNGYTYSIGGIFAARNQIAYAPLNNNGTYGTWKTQFTNYIYGLNKATVFGYNGYMYIVGGNANSRSQYCSSGSCSLVQVAPIFSDGSLGDFQSAGTLPSNSSYNNLFASVYNGNLYVPGTTNIFYSGLTSINHNAVYSYTLDSLSSVTPYGVTVSGGSLSPTGLYVGKSDDMVTIRSEDANCLGAASNIMPSLGSYFGYSIPSTNNTCSNKSTARYHLISANINDTNLFVFPGSSGAYNPSTITGFTLYYHPNSGSRLHGGSDGASGSALPYTSGVQNLQVLDTPR